MTDEEIKDVVRKYIISGVEDDNADSLNEMDAFSLPESPWFDSDAFNRAVAFYRKAEVTVTFGDDAGIPE